MSIPPTDLFRLAAALIGAVSIFLGYRLFCGAAFQRGARRVVLVTNLASGALLALFGMGILVAGVRGYPDAAQTARPAWQRKSVQRNFTAPQRTRKPANTVDRYV